MTAFSQSDVLSTGPPPLAMADDTFDARWDRWVAEGARRDRIFDKRAKVTFVTLAWTVAIATIWLVVT